MSNAIMSIGTDHWLIYTGDGVNFCNSSQLNLWGINTSSPSGKHFIANAKEGDILWFVQSKTHGKIIAMTMYRSYRKRELGPLIDVSLTDDELGWNKPLKPRALNTWDTEIHYTNLYNVSTCELLTHIVGPNPIRKYTDACKINLPVVYGHIVRYGNITNHM